MADLGFISFWKLVIILGVAFGDSFKCLSLTKCKARVPGFLLFFLFFYLVLCCGVLLVVFEQSVQYIIFKHLPCIFIQYIDFHNNTNK